MGSAFHPEFQPLSQGVCAVHVEAGAVVSKAWLGPVLGLGVGRFASGDCRVSGAL